MKRPYCDLEDTNGPFFISGKRISLFYISICVRDNPIFVLFNSLYNIIHDFLLPLLKYDNM